MIEVIIGTATKRETKMFPDSTTIRQILEKEKISYADSQVTLDGMAIGLGNMDKSLKDLNITEKCMLVAVFKANNA